MLRLPRIHASSALVRRASVYLRASLAASLALAAVAVSREAQADLSSWVFAGAGASYLSQRGSSYELKPMMQFDMGVGSPVTLPVVVGGLARVSPIIGKGTDLALAARIATQGYALGRWGLALDGGAYKRWWGPGSEGWLASLQVGAPWGITLSLNFSTGSEEDRTYGAVLGIDLLRLTVYRLSGESWWVNPRPAYRPKD
jgi:hypothetical protein